MIAHKSVKRGKYPAQIVGVIGSRADLHFALRMTNPPDLFELRLDRLTGCLDELEKKMSIFPAPIIITARHPQEGGANKLSTQRRRALLRRFLPHARYVDVELRSAKALRSVLEQACRQKVGRIISFHDFTDTPGVRILKAKARAAKSYGADIFKIAARTDTPAQLSRLFEFAKEDVDLALSAMGIGKLGRKSRRELIRRGSNLNYAHLGRATIAGQPGLSEIRGWALDVER
jgi:3-dehydroquinate dehydratase-1